MIENQPDHEDIASVAITEAIATRLILIGLIRSLEEQFCSSDTTQVAIAYAEKFAQADELSLYSAEVLASIHEVGLLLRVGQNIKQSN